MKRSAFSDRARAGATLIFQALTAMMFIAATAPAQSENALEARPRRALGQASLLRSVRAEAAEGGLRVIIETDGAADFRDFALTDPHRVVIDVAVARSLANKTIQVGRASVDRIRIGQKDSDTVRVVLDAREKISHRVTRLGSAIIIVIGSVEISHTQTEVARKPEVKVAGARVDERDDSTGREEMKAMMRRVEELEARIRELEADKTRNASEADKAKTSPTPATTERAATASTPAAHPTDMHAQSSRHEGSATGAPRMEIRGFADVSFHTSNEKGTASSFAVGQLDLFITSHLSDKFSVLGEMILEARRNNEFAFELHRLLLRYTPNDYFNLSAGRYHTAIGYYNTAYHHGQWFQTAATRPFIFAFEGQGGVLPIHNVGLTATGRIPSGAAGLRYIAEVGNGRTSRSRSSSPVQTAVDENNRKSFNVGLLSRPESAPGLQMGLSVYHDRLSPDNLPRVEQTISAAHVVYRNANYEWLNEALDIRHRIEGRRTLHTPAFYTQFARRLGEAWPYFRYQYTNAPDDDPIFQNVGRRNGPSVGLRYNLSEFAALKIQYDRTERRRLRSLDELVIQLGFTF
jgi:hypothetical protein